MFGATSDVIVTVRNIRQQDLHSVTQQSAEVKAAGSDGPWLHLKVREPR